MSTPLSHDLIQQAAPLNISTCFEPALMPLTQLFLPCESIGSATFPAVSNPPAAQEDTPSDAILDGPASNDVLSTSSGTASKINKAAAARPTAVFTGSADISAEIRPGLAALQESQRSCQGTDVFALGSSTVDVYITTQDTADTLQSYQDHCSESSNPPHAESGVSWMVCRLLPSHAALR
jgi:hypothetical protein